MRDAHHSASPARGVLLSTAVTVVLVLALAAQVTAQRPAEVITGEFGTGDSPRSPGRAAACLVGRFDVAANVPITWWFEYGPTAAYGSQTPEREREAPVDDPLERSCGADADAVHADVDDLSYGATYHYRLVGRFPDGRVEVGEDRTFTPAATALRPPQRVSFRHDAGAPGTSILTNVRVHDVPRGSLVEAYRCHDFETASTRLSRARIRGRSATVLRRVVVRRFRPEPGQPQAGVVPCAPHVTVRIIPPPGRGMETATAIFPRGRRAPRIETDCVRPFARKCVSVSATSLGPRLLRLSLESVLHGSRIRIDCDGPGCPTRRLERVVRVPRGRGPYGRLRPPGYDRLRPGARLGIFITRAGAFGAHRSLRVTRTAVLMSGYRCLDVQRPYRVAACP